MNTYKVLLPVLVNGEHKQGDVFEYEFTPEAEQANLQSGLLELQPNTYKVIGTNRVYDHDPGETFEAALTMGQEQHLVASGNVERVEAPKKTSRKKGEE